MTHQQLVDLLETYGADPDHWPRESRVEAEALVQHGDPAIAGALRQALALDVELSRYSVGPADAELARRIVASGPSSPWWQRIGRRHRLWISGAVLAGAGMGGVAAGAIGISLVAPLPGVATSVIGGGEESGVDTAFGEVGMNWSEQ
jgi:hypothetical protein